MVQRTRKHLKYGAISLLFAFSLIFCIDLSQAAEVRYSGDDASSLALGERPEDLLLDDVQDAPIERPAERPIDEFVIESQDISDEGLADKPAEETVDKLPLKAVEAPVRKAITGRGALTPEEMAAEPPVVSDKPSLKIPVKADVVPVETPVVVPIIKVEEAEVKEPAPAKVVPSTEKALKVLPTPAITKKVASEPPLLKPLEKVPAKADVKARDVVDKLKPGSSIKKKAQVKPVAKKPEKVDLKLPKKAAPVINKAQSPEAQPAVPDVLPVKVEGAAKDDFNKDKADKYDGPIDVRVKRLYGFDARLSGRPFGWVDQIHIDDVNDEVYLLDGNNKRIVVTNVIGSYLFHFDYTLAGIKNPSAFTVDSMSGEIYVAENDRIAVLNYRGEFQGNFNLSQIPDNKRLSVQSLSIVKGDDGDLLYIGDNVNRRILVFTTEGKYVRTYGNAKWVGNNIKGMVIGEKRIFWLDSTGFSVKSVDLDGTHKKSFGRISSLLGGFSMPSGMTVDLVRKRIIVVDSNRMMVIVFNYDGEILFEFGGPRLFTWPRTVAVDKHGHIFVADNRGTIRVFQAIPVQK